MKTEEFLQQEDVKQALTSKQTEIHHFSSSKLVCEESACEGQGQHRGDETSRPHITPFLDPDRATPHG